VEHLFGERSDFAIEADVEPDLKPPNAVWGHMCVWCADAAHGNIKDRYCALYPAYVAFGSLTSRLDLLWAEEFDGMEDAAIYEFLNGLLFGERFDSAVQPPSSLFGKEGRRSWDAWGRFNFLTNWGEQLDGYTSFIVCPPDGMARVLSKAFIGHSGVSASVSLTGVVTAAREFRNWFEGQELRLRG
jgi:hypothetical protein